MLNPTLASAAAGAGSAARLRVRHTAPVMTCCDGTRVSIGRSAAPTLAFLAADAVSNIPGPSWSPPV